MRVSRVGLRLSLMVAISAVLMAPSAQGQHDGSMHVKVNAPDSVAHIVDRVRLAKANFAIVSRDGTAALLLMDTTIIAEMTDTGLARMNSREATDTIKGTANRMVARMVLGALQPLFDHGIAYHLRDMADARYENGRLKLTRANGEEAFGDTEIGHGPLMEQFAPSDAIAFAKRAKAARAKLLR
jgi:hypothetical protein